MHGRPLLSLEIYNVFAKSLAALEPPAELIRLSDMNPELLDMYYQFIEEKVQPLERKAVLSARKALDRCRSSVAEKAEIRASGSVRLTLPPARIPLRGCATRLNSAVRPLGVGHYEQACVCSALAGVSLCKGDHGTGGVYLHKPEERKSGSCTRG